MRGKKGKKHVDPDDPPRRRANKARGHGTWDKDRPPVWGLVGWESGLLCVAVLHHSTRAELEPNVVGSTRPGTEVYTDEWGAYDRLPEQGRPHRAVCHAPGRREW